MGTTERYDNNTVSESKENTSLNIYTWILFYSLSVAAPLHVHFK